MDHDYSEISEKYKIDNLYKEWSTDYRSNLSILCNDIKILHQKGFEIFIAIDFYEIFQYCFPIRGIIDEGIQKFWVNDEFKNLYLKQQLARTILFFSLDKLYTKPIFLLPPYVRELNDFMIRLENDVGRFTNNEQSKAIFTRLSQEFSEAYRLSNGETEVEKLVNMLNSKAPDILFYFGRSFSSGVDVFRHIMEYHLDKTPKFMGGNFTQDNLMVEYNTIATKIKQLGNFELELKMQETRDFSNKILQNKRDAEAIRYVVELNKILIKHNKLIFLVSSATHFKKFVGEKTISCDVDGIKFDMVRGIDFIYIIAEEIGRALNYEGKKTTLNNFEVKSLLRLVAQDLAKLNNFLSENFDNNALLGPLDRILRDQNLKEVIRLNEELGNIDNSLIIEELLFHENIANKFTNIINLNQIINKKEINEALEAIKRGFASEEFNKILFQKSIELELERLTHLWPLGLGNLPSFYKHRSLATVLINFPFRLYLKDKEANQSIQKFINLNILAGEELKKKLEISKDTIECIYIELQTLSNIANRIEGEEKYILWQMVFLCLARDDLIEAWYKQFYEWVHEESIKRELAYLYSINFINNLWKKSSLRSDTFKKMIDLCSLYDLVSINIIELDPNCDKKLDGYNGFSTLFKEKGLTLPDNYEIVTLKEDIFLFYDNTNKDEKVLLLKKYGQKVESLEIDLRFVHLKAVIYNEYLCNHEIDENLTSFKANMENIFLPIITKLMSHYDKSIVSDYAYFLALNDSDKDYGLNLEKALDLIQEMEKSTYDHYLNYYEHYIFGYVYYSIFRHNLENKDLNKEKALQYFYKSIKEIPPTYNYLRKMIISLMGEML